MNVVLGITPKGDKAAILSMQDGTKVWTPEKEKAEGLMGKEIPADWTIKQGDYGPQAFPPREKKGFGPGGGAAAWRNSKEGAHFDAMARLVNTAIMQAEGDLTRAATILAWGEAQLFKGSPVNPAVPSGTPAAPQRPTASTAKVDVGAAAGSGRESAADGEDAAGSCSHEHVTFTLPSGRAVPDGKFYCEDCRKLVKG